MLTIYSTFDIAILSYMSHFIVCILSASEWIVSRFMALYKCTYYYNKIHGSLYLRIVIIMKTLFSARIYM